MPRLRLKDYLVIAGGILLIAVFTLALVASPAAAQTVANGPYYATPSWDQTLSASTRFIVLSNFNSEAVLDRETGMIWEKAPDHGGLQTWFTARTACINSKTGGRQGWRLPSVQELASLLDPSQPSDSLHLPPGHPFIGIRFEPRNPDFYWSATSSAEDFTLAWTVLFDGEPILENFKTVGLGASHGFAWCVRGGGPLVDY